jgi:hypothetical protein
LKLQIQPSDIAREIEIYRTWQSLDSGPKSQNVDAWIRKWESTYRKAVNIDLADTHKERPLLKFIDALEQFDPEFSKYQTEVINSTLVDGTPLPTMEKLIAIFKMKRRTFIAKHRNLGVNPASYASFQGEEQKSPQPPSTTTSKGIKPCLCGKPHKWATCSYLMPHLRTANWTPRNEI